VIDASTSRARRSGAANVRRRTDRAPRGGDDALMKPARYHASRYLALALACLLEVGTAAADKPSWIDGDTPDARGRGDTGHGHDSRGGQDGDGDQARHVDNYRSQEREREGRDDDDQKSMRHDDRRARFDSRQHSVVQVYYVEEFRTGRCPPGLEKKHNGCMPPGQARQWRVGHRLPPATVYYELPLRLARQLGEMPADYRYVRVATDILLIAVGSGLVVDAIQDLGRI